MYMDFNLQKTKYIKISPGLGYNNRKLAKLVDFTGKLNVSCFKVDPLNLKS